MSKCYPVIIYPSLIIKFIAQNSLPTVNNERLHDRNRVKSQAINSIFHARSKSRFKILWSLAGLIIGSTIAFSFTLLSPNWLIGFSWMSILLGGYCFWTSTQKIITPAKTTTRKTEAETKLSIGLRSHERERQLRQLLANKIVTPERKSLAQTGVSEPSFYRILQRTFSNIKQGLEFEISGFAHPYSADFALQHESGLCIDIEIDEPYVGDTKAPHHCLDQGKDDLRNEFFTSGNWIVVRFSELQAVKYPQSCCKEIAKVLARVAGDRVAFSKLQGVPDLPPDPMWTIKQAQKMARNDYRQTYLPSLVKS
jgi:very-short-patch-repair endonuclease